MKTETKEVRLILLDFLESTLCTELFGKVSKNYIWVDGIPKFDNDQLQFCFTGYFFAKSGV